MGFFSLKEVCSCCGGTTGFSKYKCRDGYICPKCFKLLRKTDKMTILLKKTGKEINSLIGEDKNCSICNKELDKDFTKVNGDLICSECRVAEKEEAKKEKAENLSKASNFSSTTNVKKFIYFNDDTEELYIPSIWEGPTFLKYEEISSFELLEDGSSISSGGVGRAVVGGALFGGAGAIVGGVTGKKKTTNISSSMEIKITTRDINNPVKIVKIFKKDLKRTSLLYKEYRKDAFSIIAILEIIVERLNAKENTREVAKASGTSKIDELKGLKELLDSGILSKEEFESEKAKVLNR
ncbi:MAG: SHOCT domain-containing protein [Clostridium sp.]